MAVMTLKGEEFYALPEFIRNYASYVTSIKGNSEKTVCEYLLDIRTFFRFYKMRAEGASYTAKELEEISISDITLEDADSVTAQNVIDFLLYAAIDRDNSPTTRMRKLSALKSLFHYLYGKKHLISSNPTSEIDSPKKGKTLPKYMSLDESVKLLEAVLYDEESTTKKRDYAMLALFLDTGMRLSELVGLNITSINDDMTTVKVIGKGNKERVIYLNSHARDALSEYLREREEITLEQKDGKALFISRLGKRISNKTVQWVVYKYLKLAGLGDKGLSTHKLRHTAATLMYQSGNVDVRVLKDILGHEQLNTTQIYTHIVDKNVENAVNQNPLNNVKIKKQ